MYVLLEVVSYIIGFNGYFISIDKTVDYIPTKIFRYNNGDKLIFRYKLYKNRKKHNPTINTLHDYSLLSRLYL